MPRLSTPITVLVLAAAIHGATALAEDPKQLIGATETIRIEPSGLEFRARVDTGAQTSSIHAQDIEIKRGGDARGKPIGFTLVNRQGRMARIEAHVAREITVRTSEGSERRYAVPLTLDLNGDAKTVLVTLNDRSLMRYRLLLGRNWLRGDYVVDVEINDED